MARCRNCQHEVCNCYRFTAEQVYGKDHVHNWIFLRQTTQRTGTTYSEISGLYSIFDVFYCSGCATHKSVLVNSNVHGPLGPRG